MQDVHLTNVCMKLYWHMCLQLVCCINVVNKNNSAQSFAVSIEDFLIQSMLGVYACLFERSIHFIPYMYWAKIEKLIIWFHRGMLTIFSVFPFPFTLHYPTRLLSISPMFSPIVFNVTVSERGFHPQNEEARWQEFQQDRITLQF